jgi:hypothetical protein
MFCYCYKLTNINIPNVEKIENQGFIYTLSLKILSLPNTIIIENDAFLNSGISKIYAPNLEVAKSLPTADNSIIIVSDKFKDCTINAENYSLTIQGTKNSYAEQYANEYNLEFIDVNALGGSIRVNDAGLRFGFSFYDTKSTDIEEYGFIYSNGNDDCNTLVLENVNNRSIRQYIASNHIWHDDNTMTFNLVFINIPKDAYSQNISARAYVKINGIYFYSDVLKRSFNGIANEVLYDNDIDEVTKSKIEQMLYT